MTRNLDSKTVAYHEAGHAVVAWLCDHMLGQCSIKRIDEEGIRGIVEHHEEGCSELFDPGVICRHPDHPEISVVRIDERCARPLTQDEAHWLDLNERLGSGDQDEGYLMIAAAGQEAQRRFAPDSVDPVHSSSDWDSVHENLERLSKEMNISIEALKNQIINRTAELLADPLVWRVVSVLAEEVLAKGIIFTHGITDTIRRTIIRDSPIFVPPGTSRQRSI